MEYELTDHAATVMRERRIKAEWVERTFANPQRREPDPDDGTLERRYAVIPEFGNRVLRVVINTTVEPPRVVSVFFDRDMRDKL